MMDFEIQRCERIIWPEILLRGLEYWLVATTIKNKETAPRFKLPAIFASSDNRTWLATRKSQKLQKDALYAEWLFSSTADQNTTCPEMKNARVPSLAQHTINNDKDDINLTDEPMTEEVKNDAEENYEKSAKESNTKSLKENNTSSPSYNDIWLRSNSCTSAVHENSNFKFMYTDSTVNNEDNKWLAPKSNRKEHKWSPKRMKLDPVSDNILSWTSTGSARLFGSSLSTASNIVPLANMIDTIEELSTSKMDKSLWLSSGSSASNRAQDNLLETSAKDDSGLHKSDKSSWLIDNNTNSSEFEKATENLMDISTAKSSWLSADNTNSSVSETVNPMKSNIFKNNNILSSWLQVKTTNSTPAKKLILVDNTNSQKHQDIIGWINNVKQEEVKVIEATPEDNMVEEKAVYDDTDSWLVKPTDKRRIIDPVDAVRTGFKTLQVADCCTTSTKASPSPSFAPVTLNLGPSPAKEQTSLAQEPSPMALGPNPTTNKSTILSEWLSTSTIKNTQVSTNQPITKPFTGSLCNVTRNRFSEAGKSLSSDTEHSSLSWVLCSESENASSRASSCDDVIMM